MRILGIETSCDETAVALIEGNGDEVSIVESLVSSQADIHAAFGGVVPEVAARSHVEVIFPLLKKLGVSQDGEGIDAIAVTAGPGLLPALRIGVVAGSTLAYAWDKPLVGVNHLEGHIYSTWFAGPLTFPALALLVSGGHTELVLMRDHGKYDVIGATRDDAAGEAFDKVAKLLDLGYPGGPAVSKLALEGNADNAPLPRPMIDSGDYDFSFSGLKTAVRVFMNENPEVAKADIAAGFQEAVVDVLVTKTVRAVEHFKPASVIMAGGVSANKQLREALAGKIDIVVPDLSLTGDNAAMIAAAGYFRARNKKFSDPLTLIPDAQMRL